MTEEQKLEYRILMTKNRLLRLQLAEMLAENAALREWLEETRGREPVNEIPRPMTPENGYIIDHQDIDYATTSNMLRAVLAVRRAESFGRTVHLVTEVESSSENEGAEEENGDQEHMNKKPRTEE